MFYENLVLNEFIRAKLPLPKDFQADIFTLSLISPLLEQV